MRVTEINNSNFCIQKINNTKHPKYISQITFTGGIDKFEKSAVSTFKQSVKNFIRLYKIVWELFNQKI